MQNQREVGETLTFEYLSASVREPVVTIGIDDELAEAVTKMLIHGFSQLPVTNGRQAKPKGVVTWETIGRALAIDARSSLRDCVDKNPPTKRLQDALLPSIATINQTGYIIVTNNDDTISGIVTTADLGEALADTARPMLLLEQLETQLRRIIDHLRTADRLTMEDISGAISGPEGDDSTNRTTKTLTLGELQKIFASNTVWQSLPSAFHRNTINRELGDVVKLRNTFMHFRKPTAEERDTLQRLGATTSIINTIHNALVGV